MDSTRGIGDGREAVRCDWKEVCQRAFRADALTSASRVSSWISAGHQHPWLRRPHQHQSPGDSAHRQHPGRSRQAQGPHQQGPPIGGPRGRAGCSPGALVRRAGGTRTGSPWPVKARRRARCEGGSGGAGRGTRAGQVHADRGYGVPGSRQSRGSAGFEPLPETAARTSCTSADACPGSGPNAAPASPTGLYATRAPTEAVEPRCRPRLPTAKAAGQGTSTLLSQRGNSAITRPP